MAIAGFKQVGIVGAGQMGSGIAQVCAAKGLKVILIDSNANALARAKQSIQRSSEKLFEKGKLSADEQAMIGGIEYAETIELLEGACLAIEAIIENEGIKKELIKRLDDVLPKESVIATNTSSLPITRLAAATARPDRFVGIHFMNPVPLMSLVEIIPGLATSEETKNRAVELAEGLGKEVSLSQDYPGFVVNRILMPMINEAFTALMEGVASPEDIDKGMKLGTNQPMGPLTLADFIGLDTCLAIMEVLHSGLGDNRYRPSPLLRQYVDAGWYGKKSGRGVYQY